MKKPFGPAGYSTLPFSFVLQVNLFDLFDYALNSGHEFSQINPFILR